MHFADTTNDLIIISNYIHHANLVFLIHRTNVSHSWPSGLVQTCRFYPASLPLCMSHDHQPSCHRPSVIDLFIDDRSELHHGILFCAIALVFVGVN